MDGEAVRGVLEEDEPRAVKRFLHACRDNGVAVQTEVAEYIVASFVSCVCDEKAATETEWKAAMLETLESCEVIAEEEDRDMVASTFAKAAFDACQKQAPNWRKAPEAGDLCYAVLAEDGEWHEAVVERVCSDSRGSPNSEVTVRFVEFDKLQTVVETGLRARDGSTNSLPDGDGATCGVGACELCRRTSIPLTRHHLIPRRTHARYKKKGVPPKELEASAYICRPCHSAVHHAEDEATLASDYYTVELLLQHPEIRKSAEYFGRQAARQR